MISIGIDPAAGETGVTGMCMLVDGELRKTKTYKRSKHDQAKVYVAAESHVGSIIATLLAWLRGMESYDGVIVACELPFGRQQGQLRAVTGAVKKWLASENGFPRAKWVDVPAASAKKALTGNGRAEKEDMVMEAQAKMNVVIDGTEKEREAVSDAIGIALAGINKNGAENV